MSKSLYRTITRPVLSGKHLCRCVCACVCTQRNNEMGWKQRCCHTYVCTLALQKSMKSYTNGDIYIACSIALLCQDTRLPSGTGSTALFPRGRGRGRRARLTTRIEATSHRQRQGDEKMQLWRRDGVLEPGTSRTELCIRGWINISPHLSPALPGAASYNNSTDNLGGSEALIHHIY